MKICYVSLTGHGLFDKQYAKKNPYGGAEVAMHTDAHEMAKDKQFDVHLLAQADTEQKRAAGNLTVWTINGNMTDSRIWKSVQYHRALWRKMKEINADTYVYRAATGEIYFLIGLFCKLYRKKCVHILGVVPQDFPFKTIRYLRWKLLLQAGLQLADKIVALAHDQIPAIRPSLRNKTTVIYTGKHILKPKNEKRKYFLWVGRARPEKRPEILTRLAEQLPNKKFVMIGMHNGHMPPNIRCMPEVPNEQMHTYYSKAIATISTSTIEGFSNVYLESWNNGTPVIAMTVDTDEAICKHNLGYHSHTFEQLVKDTKIIGKSWKEKSKNSRAYVKKRHNISKQIEKYKELFRSMAT